jgi:hypothetical protein
LIQVKATLACAPLEKAKASEDRMRNTGELLYLLMVIGVFTIFAIVLAWVERTWQPGKQDQEQRSLPRAAE